MATTKSPAHSSEYDKPSLHREGVTSADTIANVSVDAAMNMATYDEAIIEVRTKNALSQPTITIYWWSPSANVYIRDHTLLTYTGPALNTPFTVTVPCKGRKMFVALSGTLTGGVDIRVTGYRTFVGSV